MRNVILQLLPTLLTCVPSQSSLQSWWSFELVTIIIHSCMLNCNINLVKLHLSTTDPGSKLLYRTKRTPFSNEKVSTFTLLACRSSTRIISDNSKMVDWIPTKFCTEIHEPFKCAKFYMIVYYGVFCKVYKMKKLFLKHRN